MKNQYPQTCPDCGRGLTFQETRLPSGEVNRSEALCLHCLLEIICRPDGTILKSGRWMARAFQGRKGKAA